MMKLVSRAVVGLAFSTVALTSVHAQSVAIKVSDLDLSNPAQMQTLQSRVQDAAYKMCSESGASRNLSKMATCEAGVRAEVADKLSQSQGSLAAAKATGKMTFAQR